MLNSEEVIQGIVAPQENLNKKNTSILGQGYEKGEGIFVLNKKEVEEKSELCRNVLALVVENQDVTKRNHVADHDAPS